MLFFRLQISKQGPSHKLSVMAISRTTLKMLSKPAYRDGWTMVTSIHSQESQCLSLNSQSPYSYTLINGEYGFSPDALDSVENFREQLFAVANIRPSNEGVYNLPVCVLNELSSIPECWKAIPTNDDEGAASKTPLTWDQLSSCFIHPINCLGGKWLESS